MKEIICLIVLLLSVNCLFVNSAYSQHEIKPDKYDSTKHDNTPILPDSHNSTPLKAATNEKPIESSNIHKENQETQITDDNQHHREALSCVLLKSFAYGVQKAVDEYAAGNHDSNLSRAVRDINVGTYLSDFCPPTPSSKQSKRSIKKAEDFHKVVRNKSANEAMFDAVDHVVNATAGKPFTNEKVTGNSITENVPKHSFGAKLNKVERLDRMEKLITTFEEVANALKLMQNSQAVKNTTPNKQHYSSLTNPENQESAIPNRNKAEKVEKPDKNEIGNANSKPEKQSQISGHNLNNSSNFNSTGANGQTKSRHYHVHGPHFKHGQSRTKSKNDAPSNVEGDTYDDRYVVERMKQEQFGLEQKQQQVKDTNKQDDKEDRKVGQKDEDNNSNNLPGGKVNFKNKNKAKRSVDKKQFNRESKNKNKHVKSKIHQKLGSHKSKFAQKKSKNGYKSKVAGGFKSQRNI